MGFTSCVSNEVSIIVENKSDKSINQINFGINGKSKSKSALFEPNETFNGKIIFDNDVVGDGNYFIELFFNDGSKKNKNFGYYTNGKPLNKSILLKVKNDTITIEY